VYRLATTFPYCPGPPGRNRSSRIQTLNKLRAKSSTNLEHPFAIVELLREL
jgi:hypothetical protein